MQAYTKKLRLLVRDRGVLLRAVEFWDRRVDALGMSVLGFGVLGFRG